MARIYRNCFFRAIYFLFYTSYSFINIRNNKLLSLWRATLRKKKSKLKKLKYLFFTSYGVIIFSLLFIFNVESVNKVIFQIASIQVPYQIFVYLLIASFSVFLSFFFIDKSLVKNLFLEIALLFF